jgi:hypothetical protein
VIEAEGLPMLTVGAVLSTVKVALGPAAGAELPAKSVPVPEAIERPIVPLPLKLESVTVRVEPLPETLTVPAVAVPVVFKLMFPEASVLELKLASA